MRSKVAVILMTLFLLSPVVAMAEPKGGVELKSYAEMDIIQKSTNGKGEVKRVDAAKTNVVPGDTVIYTIRYLNRGDQPATDVVINNPVPEHMLYIDKSAEGAGTRIDFSVDNGKTYGSLNKLKVKASNGKERPAKADDITTIKWVIEKPLLPGGTGSVSFQAKVK